MGFARTAALLAALSLAAGTAVLLAGAARGLGWSADLSRGRALEVSPEEAQRLATYPHDITFTYFVSSQASMPSALRSLERDVLEVLSALERASKGRVEARILRPDEDPSFERYAASRGAAPTKRRSVVADRYSETTLWSTLEIAAGPLPPVLIRSLGPEQVPHLRALLLAHLDALLDPPRPLVAIDAPSGFGQLGDMLRQVADVVELDLDAGDVPPPRADLLIWLEPRNTDPAVLDRLDAFREDGGSLWIAGSAFRAEVLAGASGSAELRLSERGLDSGALWSRFGLRPLGQLLLDERSQAMQLGEETLELPFLVRCLGHNQDFRGFVDQPAGSLLFAAPTALALDGELLAKRRLSARVLGTSSDLSATRDLLPGPPDAPKSVPLAQLQRSAPGARPAAKQPLLVWLEPDDPWAGAVLAMGATSALHDSNFRDPAWAHERMAQIAALELLSNSRLVSRRTELARPERLPPLERRARLFLRLAVLLALPGLLLGVAFARGAFRGAGGIGAKLRPALWFAGAILGLFAASGLGVRLLDSLFAEADLSARGANRLSEVTERMGREAARSAPLGLVWYGSPLSALAPEQRASARRALALWERFARHVDSRLVRVDPSALSEDERRALELEGIAPFQVRSEEGERATVRAVYATLVLERGDRRELLHFPDSLAFEDSEFRLAHGLHRLNTGRRTRIALCTDAPRLSPAEAQLEFQNRQRFAPSGTDVYSLARGALERADFEVVHVAPQLGNLPEDVDGLIWLQPRRSIGRMMDALVRHLVGGGRAMIAAQHFALLPQQHEGSSFRTVYWPQPQVPDLDTVYLPELGVELVREVLFDRRAADVPLVAAVGSEPGQKTYETHATALPFLLRAPPPPSDPHPLLRGVGEQALPFGNEWRMDGARLDGAGLTGKVLWTTSPRSWSFPWKGGFLPEERLAGPEGDYRGERPLMVSLEGQFPMPIEPLFQRPEGETAPPDPEPKAGELLLLGCSEMFKNDRILDPRFRADRLLVNAAAHLGLPADLAALAGRRAVPSPLPEVDEGTRVLWRTAALSGGPVVALGLWLLALLRQRGRAQ